ncbi:P2Y purinoceptor 8-like [Pristis pectinata]|uniref:P2Y purinoceptor 8-like n=1 Tax=Pristis pectinata TaxID=685728 RepID=UPI00223DA3E7|nr:P2Y purinoceptor 8-like [Pristis pectinata]
MDMNITGLDNETLEMLNSAAIRITVPTIYLVVIIVGLPGNGTSFVLLCFHTHPKTPLVIFMINLAITDLLLAFFLPFQIAYHLNHSNWIFGKNHCTFVTTLFYANMYCSILTMTCISIERYLGVVHPIWYRAVWKKKHAMITCLVIWAVLLIVLLPFEYSDLTFDVQELKITTCFDVLKRNMLPDQNAWGLFLFSLFVLLFLIPFTITVVCYVLVILKLSQNSHTVERKKKKRATYLAATVLLVFIMCFAPSNITLLIHIILRFAYNKGCYTAYKLTLSLSCLNSCLNPFIFCFASSEFQKRVYRLINWRQSHYQSSTAMLPSGRLSTVQS